MTDPHDPVGPSNPVPPNGPGHGPQGSGGGQWPDQGASQNPWPGDDHPHDPGYPQGNPTQGYPQNPGYPPGDQTQALPQTQPQYSPGPGGGGGAGGGQVGGPPAEAPTEGSGIGVLIAIVVVMLLVGGTIGYFTGSALSGDDDTDEVVAEAQDTTTVAAPAVDPDTWAELDGTLQASMPTGMQVRSFLAGAGQRGLSARPTVGAKLYETGGINVLFDRRPDMTPEKELDIDPVENCPTIGDKQAYSYGEFTGLRQAFSGCPGGTYEVHRIAVAIPGGTNLLVSVGQTPGDDAVLEKALDTFRPEADPATQVAQPSAAMCDDLEDSPKPDWPLSLRFANYLDDTVTYGWLDQVTGQVDQPQDLEAGYSTGGTLYTKEGDKFRFTTPSGDPDHTATAEARQCVYLTKNGFVAAPG